MSYFKNKTIATLLASLGGLFGLHRFYLDGARGWVPWFYPVYTLAAATLGLRYLGSQHADLGAELKQFVHPALMIALLPAFAGFIEALVFALTPDAIWDAKYNAGSARQNNSGWAVIIIAVLTLGFGAVILMTTIAISAQTYYESVSGSE